jgi:orotate phosphoribosyltransferase
VDDVFTTGAHIRAAATRLRSEGVRVLFGACVCLATRDPAANNFRVEPKTVEFVE